MIDIRHLIRADAGRIRVLRLARSYGRCYPLAYRVRIGTRGVCRVCCCTDRWGCYAGCSWWDSTHRLCSRCAETYPLLSEEEGDV